MVALKKLIAPVLTGAALAFSSASAFALNVGEAGSLADMQAKLANENQVEIANGATGNGQTLRGVKFYYNQASKVGYIALTNDPVRPTQMRIIFQTTKTTPGASVNFGDPTVGAVRCEQLATEGVVAKGKCASFKDTLDVNRNAGMEVIQQGTMPTLNVLTTFINPTTGVGNVYESTQDGATVMKLIVGNAKYTEEGSRLARLAPTKTASNGSKIQPNLN